jgi:hypothetical protein
MPCVLRDDDDLCLPGLFFAAVMLLFPVQESRRKTMSERALEFVETWVSEKIEREGHLEDGKASPAKEWAAECREAAMEAGIPSPEIDAAFDDLAEFIEGEIEGAREREEDEDDDDEDEDDEDEEGSEDDKENE